MKTPGELLEASEYLFLREIGEPSENSLRLVVEEAVVGSEEYDSSDVSDPIIREVARGAHEIISDSNCHAYAVRNESFVSADKREQFEGRFLRRYSASRFLDYVANSTFADSSLPGIRNACAAKN